MTLGTDDQSTGSQPIDRRRFAGLLGGLALLPAAAMEALAAETRVGAVEAAEGSAFARLSAVRRLRPEGEILLGDLVWTAAGSRTSLGLDGGTRIHLGSRARLTIDRYVAETGGTLTLGEGALVLDRDDDLPKTALAIRTTFGLIGVRGTRFFAGPSKGVFGVFVERGSVRVLSGGVERRVPAGYGVDVAAQFAAPSEVKTWGRARIEAAFESVLG